MKSSKRVTIVASLLAAAVVGGMTVQTAYSQSGPPASAAAPLPQGVTRVPVVFSGGYDTDPRDRGRPVTLIAAALGVAPEVFRDAFTHVHPARMGSEPEPDQVRANKAALLNALGKYGITNDRLDTVSNYYRYPPGRNLRWRTRSAVANALIKGGAVVGYEIVSGGSGYMTPPTVSVPGVPGASSRVKLAFGKQMESNGSVSTITLSDANGDK